MSAPRNARSTRRAPAATRAKARRARTAARAQPRAVTSAQAKTRTAKRGKSATRAKSSKRAKPEQLSLSGRGTRGGYRAGSGRKRIPRDKRGYVPHTKRPNVTKSTPVHITLRCVDGLPSLRRPTHKAIIETIFAEENRKGFRLVHFAILTNHLHLIAEGDTTDALSRGVQRVASRIARTLNKRWARKGRFVRERFDGKVIKTPRQMRNALRYVLLNHHKHELESTATIAQGIDRYSSSHLFDGWLPIPDGGPRPKTRHPKRGDPVVPPTCWLLTKGWRKHGAFAPVWI